MQTKVFRGGSTTLSVTISPMNKNGRWVRLLHVECTGEKERVEVMRKRLLGAIQQIVHPQTAILQAFGDIRNGDVNFGQFLATFAGQDLISTEPSRSFEPDGGAEAGVHLVWVFGRAEKRWPK